MGEASAAARYARARGRLRSGAPTIDHLSSEFGSSKRGRPAGTVHFRCEFQHVHVADVSLTEGYAELRRSGEARVRS